jgi:hypothetical protein
MNDSFSQVFIERGTWELRVYLGLDPDTRPSSMRHEDGAGQQTVGDGRAGRGGRVAASIRDLLGHT